MSFSNPAPAWRAPLLARAIYYIDEAVLRRLRRLPARLGTATMFARWLLADFGIAAAGLTQNPRSLWT